MDKVKLYFMRYYIDILTKKYVKFDGRARREEYWFFALFSFIVSTILGIIDGFIMPAESDMMMSSGPLELIYTLAIIIPSIALLIRRLHDLDKSGWWALLNLIPIVGWIWLFILTVLPGTQGPNRFGEEPLPLAMDPQLAPQTANAE